MHRFRSWTLDPPEYRTQRNRLLPIEGGDGSTLNLDFTTGVLDSRLSFIRNSTATYINSSGYVTSIGAAPTNDPTKARFDYDPTSIGTPRGLLIEGQATNLMFRSQAMNTGPWGINGGTMTISETGSGSPANDATSNVVTWTNGTGSGSAWLQQNVPVSAGNLVVGTAYTWSVWLKSRGGRRVNVFANIQGVTGNREVRVDFGVSPPTVTSTVATGWTSIQIPTIVEYPNGWYKVTTGGTLPSGATSVNFGFNNSDAVPASGTNGFEAWGYQLEAGSGASSYIPTGASQGTRLRDECSITGGNFSSWFTNPNEGSFFVQYSLNYPSASMGAGVDRYAFEISDSLGSSRALCIAAYRNAPAGRNVRVFNPSGTSFDSGDTLTTSDALNTKFAFGYATANNYIAAVGVAQPFQTYNTGSLPTSPAINQMWIGTNRNLSVSTYLFGCIRTIKYWPTRLPNATLQGLVS